jgi:hypothetical protein
MDFNVDEICDRIMRAFDGHEGYLNGSDLLAAAGVPRTQYLKALDVLVSDTHELVVLDSELGEYELLEGNDDEIAYIKPALRRQAEAVGSQS